MANNEDLIIPRNRTLALFLVSIWGLFLEMLLIRWVGTEIRIFSYMQNTVLVVCFLGLGLGCLTSRQPVMLRRSLFYLCLLTFLLAVPVTREWLARISGLLSVLHDSASVMWAVNRDMSLSTIVLDVVVGLAMTYLVMMMLLGIFIPVGRLLGRLFDEHPNTIQAYSVNIAGSLAGTWLFVALSFFYQPPVIWVLIVALLALVFLDRKTSYWRLNLALLACMVVLAWFAGRQPGSMGVVWSPYQKLTLYKADTPSRKDNIYQINVNNVGYQAMFNLSPDFTRSYPDHFSPDMNGLSQYDIPFLIHPKPRNVLLVGAGSGNDAAGALRNGAEEITAVDIDPAILSLGRQYHPEKPYSSSKVKTVNDDARSFFANCGEKFDVIVFCLLDSHTSTAMTNARLDNYVYTRESIAKAKSLLNPGGVMVVSFEVRKPYIGDRLAGVLRETFGQDPLCFAVPNTHYGFGGMMLVTGDLPAVKERISGNTRLAAMIEKWRKDRPIEFNHSTVLADDDWPYLYLEKPGIPKLYYLLAALMLFLTYQSSRHMPKGTLFGGFTREHWHFFFLGAAFLLLEVQNISKASVVLGNTWDVNAVIVSGVLVMILGANLLVYRFPKINLWVVYAALCITCLALYRLDLARFAFLPYGTKALVVGGLTTLPILFSGIIFMRSFAQSERKDLALGANLIGALFGALTQSVTFVTGIRALLLIVLVFYILAMLTRPRQVFENVHP